jgi:hypothetical protein
MKLNITIYKDRITCLNKKKLILMLMLKKENININFY